jgi:hypothetical protein
MASAARLSLSRKPHVRVNRGEWSELLRAAEAEVLRRVAKAL